MSLLVGAVDIEEEDNIEPHCGQTLDRIDDSFLALMK